MKKRRPDQITPFSELPRSRGRDLYVRLRWKIRRTASYYGGKFTSDVLLDEAGSPARTSSGSTASFWAAMA
ncbi:hypothetical protein [Nitrosospira multiformis]|uniref:hypothetical protein n=1 Tax=Nitrosospira multiformis TaxID=1231 RepID=UPI0009436741|nr:hypothetical protein [Nitrosospira multiformis]